VYNAQDTAGTVAALGAWWDQLTRGRVVPSGFDDLLQQQSQLLTDALGLAPADASLDTLGRLAEAAGDQVRSGQDGSAVLQASLALVHQGGQLLRSAGSLPATDRGQVAQLNMSGGGVPKLPVDSFMIGPRGPVGDKQRTRLHHGRPWQAVCLWAAEVVDAFAAEGHPIAYGSAGENITTVGIPWGQVQAGVHIRVGEALLEASLWALPCSKNAQWFIARDYSLMHHDRGPVSRMYASVLEPGLVRLGDDIILEP
jgi:MOSC domain-containing protein YiiM